MQIDDEAEMRQFGEKIGRSVKAGDVIELVGDVGAGKTTFVRGLAKGMGIDETIQSPTFTISKVYETADKKILAHYDFYRLENPGIMADELHDTLTLADSIVVVEWAGTVEQVLPVDRLTIAITADAEDHRIIDLGSGGSRSQALREAVLS